MRWSRGIHRYEYTYVLLLFVETALFFKTFFSRKNHAVRCIVAIKNVFTKFVGICRKFIEIVNVLACDSLTNLEGHSIQPLLHKCTCCPLCIVGEFSVCRLCWILPPNLLHTPSPTNHSRLSSSLNLSLPPTPCLTRQSALPPIRISRHQRVTALCRLRPERMRAISRRPAMHLLPW